MALLLAGRLSGPCGPECNQSVQPERHLRVHVRHQLPGLAGEADRLRPSRLPARLLEHAGPAQPARDTGPTTAALERTRTEAAPARQGVFLQPFRRGGGCRMLNPWLGISFVLVSLGG